MSKPLLASLLCIVASCSCSISPSNAPPGQQSSIAIASKRFCTLTIVRAEEGNPVTSQALTPVQINGWLVGTLAAGEYLNLDKPPGTYTIQAKRMIKTITLEQGRHHYLLLKLNKQGKLEAIKPIYRAEAMRQIRSQQLHSER